jgi:hypothetical protein
MDSNAIIIWTVILGATVLILSGLPVLRGKLASTSSQDVPAALGSEGPTREPAETELVVSPTDQGERDRLIEAKCSAEQAHAQRVRAAEDEFNAIKLRADIHLRAAEISLEHAEQSDRGHLKAIRGTGLTLEPWQHDIDVDSRDGTEEFFLSAGAARTTPAVKLATRLVESPERKRNQRIRSAREQLADAMLEHHVVLAAAEKFLAEAKAQDDDVVSAAAALDAFDACDERQGNGAEPGQAK